MKFREFFSVRRIIFDREKKLFSPDTWFSPDHERLALDYYHVHY
jgi:hypothetical protein